MQKVRVIDIAMYSYSNDNDQNYPDGNSSTEIFQQLMDGGYVTDSRVFYIPLPGKIKPVAGEKLKPENISFDVTCCADTHASKDLPLVFMTGYRVTYKAGSPAIPMTKPYPQFGGDFDTWWQWWHAVPQEPGIAVGAVGNSTKFMKLETSSNSDASIPNFVPADFDPKGKSYRQLTPDGPLPSN